MVSDDGGSAFPLTYKVGTPGEASTVVASGMSLRDWFAGQAMIALLQAGSAEHFKPFTREALERAAAQSAYQMADAMLKARKVKHDEPR